MPASHEIVPEAPDVSIAVFNESEFARLLGMTITGARDGYAEVVMDTAGKKNPDGVAHGGAIFALADQAFGIAANCGGKNRVAVSVHILYIAPATGMLIARATQVAQNGNYFTYRILVTEGTRLIAEFEGVSLQVNPHSR